MNVYLVTSGIYSDYQIHCAFSTKKLAEEYILNIYKNQPYEDIQPYENIPGSKFSAFEHWLSDYNFGVEEYEVLESMPVVTGEELYD